MLFSYLKRFFKEVENIKINNYNNNNGNNNKKFTNVSSPLPPRTHFSFFNYLNLFIFKKT